MTVLLITRHLAFPINKNHFHLQVFSHYHYLIHILDNSAGQAAIRLSDQRQEEQPPTSIPL